MATFLLYLQSKSELPSTNTHGSVVVHVNVCFVTVSQKWRIIIPSNVIQSNFVKLGKGTTNTYEKIQKAFDNNFLSCAHVFQWHKDFVNGQEMVEDEL
jgi:hypothetical protein